MKHSEKPQIAIDLPDEVKKKMQEISCAEYSKQLKNLIPLVKNRIVRKAIPGRTGFVLFLSDETWVITFLESEILLWDHGSGRIPPEKLKKIENPQFGDGYEKLNEDLPYSNEICDISKEIENCIDQEILGLAIGLDCFNFCFPQKMELETMIMPGTDGKNCLRVFWEQW